MRAQEVGTQIDPRSLPVPVDRGQTPQEMQDAVNREGRNRAEELRRLRAEEEALRRRPAQQVPNAPPPDRPRRGGRLFPVFDPFALASEIGKIIGEEAGAAYGEEKYGQTPAEVEAANRRERELRERVLEQERQLDMPMPPIPPRRQPPATPRGIEAYGAVQGGGRVMRPIPQMTIPPPAPKRSRAQRALHQIQRVTSNPWAQLGVFGLGLLGGRRRSQNVLPTLLPLQDELGDAIDAPPATAVSPNLGIYPFSSAGFGYGGPPPTTTAGCDCKPKRKGPKRRCLERAQVAWRTGRYKGKLAGTRCVRWE